MSEQLSLGISITNACYECQVIAIKGVIDTPAECYECKILAQDKAKGYPVGYCQTCADNAMLKATNYQAGKCATCLKDEEANADTNAWNLHEEDRLGEGPSLSLNTSDSPSSSDWVSSQTYVRPPGKKARMIEKWDSDNPFKLVELRVEFIDEDEPMIRHEFLPPIAQLIDGGEFEELWELDDMMQAKRETECKWCHIMTPKIYNDCQSCDKPL